MNRTDQKAAVAHGDYFGHPARCAQGCPGVRFASEEVAMRAGAGQFENEDVFVDLVDEKPVGCDVAFAVVGPVADERMVAVLWRKLLSVGKLVNDGLKLFNRKMPLQHQLVVALERGRVADRIFHFARSFHIWSS